MKKGWTTTKLIALGSLATLQFVINLPISGVFAASGSNPMAGLIYLITGPIFEVVALLLIQNFGCLTIRSIFITLISIPLPKVYPPPFSFLLGPIIALILDSLFYFLRHKKLLSSFIIGGTSSFLQAFSLYLIFLTIGYANAQKVPSFIFQSLRIVSRVTIIFAIIFALGMISGYLGYLIYQKIKDTTIVRRIQAS